MIEHNFAIFKNTKKDPNNPKDHDYYLSVPWGEEYITCGKGWIKEGKAGKYMSCQFSKPWKNLGGWGITRLAPEAMQPEVKPPVNSFDDIQPNPEDIPFSQS